MKGNKMFDEINQRVAEAKRMRLQGTPAPLPPGAPEEGAATVEGNKQNSLLDRSLRVPSELVLIEQVAPDPNQPRRLKAFKYICPDPEVEELAESILNAGLQNPITVERVENGYHLVSGERRLRAFLHNFNFHNGPRYIPAHVWDNLNADERLTLQLHENMPRKALSKEEIKSALKRRYEELGNVSEVCRRFKLSRATYYRLMSEEKKTDRISTGQFLRVAERLSGRVDQMPILERAKLLQTLTALCEQLRNAPPPERLDQEDD